MAAVSYPPVQEKDVSDISSTAPQLPVIPRDTDTLSVRSRASRRSTPIPQYGSMPRRPQSAYTRGRSEYSSSEYRPQPVSRHSDFSARQMEDPAMASKLLARRATLLGWFDESETHENSDGLSSTCVAIKEDDGQYIFMPPMHDLVPSLSAAITRLDDTSVMSMASDITESVIDSIAKGQRSLIDEITGARIPIVSSFDDVHSGFVHTSRSCIVMKERVVLVWSQDSANIINVAHEVEKQFLDNMNDPEISNFTTPRMSGPQSMHKVSATPSRAPSLVRGALDEKDDTYRKAVALEEGTDEDDEGDLEAALPPRPVTRMHAVKISLAIMLVIITQCLGVSKLLREYWWDGSYLRFLLVITIPPLALFSLFFFIVLITSIFQLFLPASVCLKNTKFHSAIKPNPKRHKNYELPHITIQMPVYKEGLKGVIVPTMVSVMAAIQYYEEQGGTASVFINDDGMQCIKPELADARKKYYRKNGIGYTARLPTMKGKPVAKKGGLFSWIRKSDPTVNEAVDANFEDSSPQAMANRLGFERKGKFKKASNMNYGLAFSNRVEDELARLSQIECERRGCRLEELSIEDDDELYEQALQNMLDADQGKTWAEGNIRIGELILIIDCDTRVPVDCLLYGALEMYESPEVAILQHGSGVMQVVNNTFENGITYFTNIVYTAIKYGVGTGDVSPFVGHNAFLRWKALQSIEFVDPTDGQTKWWSDAHVSEDFDISLRLQMKGNTIRLATYHNGGFKEGVSLTVYDELTRWEKYAYGCNELVFHPFYQWIYKGPVTRLFLRFLWSNIPVTSKVTITAYIFTYYAIASGMLLTVVNYVLVGLFPDDIDHYYQPSWGIWCSLVVVFNLFGSIAFSMARHQLKEAVFWRALLDAIKWLPFLVLYFGGISLNCAKALLCHAFSINIEWASTAKEAGPSGFYISLEQMVKMFKWTWVICILLAGVMIYFAVGAPWGWTINPSSDATATIAIVPLAMQICSAFFLPVFLGLN